MFWDGRIPDLRIPDAVNISLIYLMLLVGAGLLTLRAVVTTVSAFKQNGLGWLQLMVTCYITSLPDAVTTE